MSMYGPPGGPYPGQPQDPWQPSQSRDPYDTPADQYGNNPPRDWASDHSPGQAGYGQPYQSGYEPAGYQPAGGYEVGAYNAGYVDAGYGEQNFPQGEVWGPPQAPERNRSGLLVGGVIALILITVAGGTAYYLLNRDSGDKSGNESTATPSLSATASSRPNGASSGTNSDPAVGEDARMAKIGDCLVNRGTEQQPDMRKVACAPGTYQVLKRIDGTADKARCDGTPNLTDWYFYDHPDNSHDFVLCLRKR